MHKPLKTLFVIADGSRARWVKHVLPADDFVTEMEMHAKPRATGHPEGVVFEGGAGQRFTVEPHMDAVRHHRELFAEDLAERINSQAAEDAFERLAIVAPARLLNAIVRKLSPAASARLVTRLAKDLTKTPDHELGQWLRHLELAHTKGP